MNAVETLFHQVFGTRGVSDVELSTTDARAELQDLYNKLAAKVGTFDGDKLVSAVALLSAINRHLQTYPETTSELLAWSTSAASLSAEAKGMLGISPWLIAAGLLALAGGAYLWMNR